MPTPTSSTTVQRPDLGTLAYETWLESQRDGFIGLKAAPVFETNEKSADYPFIPMETLINVKDTKRAPRSNYNRSDWQFETKTYNCQDNGWEELLDDEEVNQYKYLFDAESVAVERAVHIILMNHEIRTAAMMFNTSNFSNTAVTTEWSTAASATPHKDVTVTGWSAFKAQCGMTPTHGVCSDTVFRNLVNTDEVKQAFRSTGNGPLEVDGYEAQKRAMAQYFGLKEIFVGSAVKSITKKNKSASPTDIWDDEYFGLYRIESGMDLRRPQAARTFLWTRDSPDILVTEQYREEKNRGDVYRVRHNVDEAVINANCGYLLSNITA
jgi:hypothetical protein